MRLFVKDIPCMRDANGTSVISELFLRFNYNCFNDFPLILKYYPRATKDSSYTSVFSRLRSSNSIAGNCINP